MNACGRVSYQRTREKMGEFDTFSVFRGLMACAPRHHEFPEIVKEIDRIMDTACVPSQRYQVGKLYEGGPIWKKTTSQN